DLLVSLVELGLFLIRNDHVGDPDRNSGARRPAESEFLEAIKRFNGLLLTRNLICPPDDVAQLFLPSNLVDESESFRPDSIEDHPARGCLDHFDIRVSVDRLLAEVRILEPNFFVNLDRSFG